MLLLAFYRLTELNRVGWGDVDGYAGYRLAVFVLAGQLAPSIRCKFGFPLGRCGERLLASPSARSLGPNTALDSGHQLQPVPRASGRGLWRRHCGSCPDRAS